MTEESPNPSGPPNNIPHIPPTKNSSKDSSKKITRNTSKSHPGGKGRRGPWASDEKVYIEENYTRLSPNLIADKLRRDVLSVKKYIRENCTSQVLDKKIVEDAKFKLKDSMVWEDLKRQFTGDELNMFLFHWSRTISQFKEDVLPTEEMQIIDMIKLDVLMNRSLTEQRKVQEMLSDLEARRQDELDKPPERRDIARLDNIERQMGVLRTGQTAMSTDYKDMQTRKNSILKEMKATRDARIKDIESDKLTISTFLIKLIEDKDTRLRIGREMEKMRLATECEYIRLSEFHKYEDGMLDRPILDSNNANIVDNLDDSSEDSSEDNKGETDNDNGVEETDE